MSSVPQSNAIFHLLFFFKKNRGVDERLQRLIHASGVLAQCQNVAPNSADLVSVKLLNRSQARFNELPSETSLEDVELNFSTSSNAYKTVRQFQQRRRFYNRPMFDNQSHLQIVTLFILFD